MRPCGFPDGSQPSFARTPARPHARTHKCLCRALLARGPPQEYLGDPVNLKAVREHLKVCVVYMVHSYSALGRGDQAPEGSAL